MLHSVVRALALVAILSLAVAESPEGIAIHGLDAEIHPLQEEDLDLGDAGDLGESGGPPKAVSKIMGKLKTEKKPGPLKVRNSKAFSKIPNFVVAGTAKTVKDVEGCMIACEEQKECRSLSYHKRNKKCFWSTGSVRYNHKWTFFSKEYDLNAFGKMMPTSEFHKFPGIFAIDEDQNMKTKTGKSLNECKDLCNEDIKCMAFSFNEHDHACLMGVQKVEYKEGWMYYERNKEPTRKNGKWMPYPLRMDAYHKEQHKEELKTLKLFAERDKKVRIKKEKKQEIMQKKMKYMEKKRKRLDQEMKVKLFAREQRKKKWDAIKAQRKVDNEAAAEKGAFDEAFHKQKIKNTELLHKRKMEVATKAGVKEKQKKWAAGTEKRFEAHMVRMKARGMKKIVMDNDVIRAKEKKVKEKKHADAVRMKTDAFQLVQQERTYKSRIKNDGRRTKLKKKQNKANSKRWKAIDQRNKANAGEIETKRKIKVEKDERRTKIKLAKEKISKKPPKGAGKLPGNKKQPTLPKLDPKKPKSLPKRAPGKSAPPMDVSKKATTSKKGRL